MIRQLAIWFWKAWPVHIIALLIGVHLLALAEFPCEAILINKLTGTIMQIVGGLIVLFSVDSNLGLFRKQSLAATVIAWFRGCPVFVRSVTLSATGSISCGSSASASVSISHAATTVEERLAELERRLEELRSEMASQHRAVNSRIEEMKSEFSTSLDFNKAEIGKLSGQVEMATVGGFKQQAFGVLLVIYGAVIGVFA